MDAKITKKRLNHFLSYDWIKIVAVAVAAIVGWNLIFTTTETRRLPSQAYQVMNYSGTTLSETATGTLSTFLSEGKFSHEVIETECVDATRAGVEYLATLLEATFTTDGCDVVAVANVNDPASETETEDGKVYMTYAQELLRSYNPYVMDADEFFNAARAYLNTYYTNGYQDETSLDKNKIESDFRARVLAAQDKRYKTEESILQTVVLDIQRIEKYRQALLNVEGYLESGYLRLDLVTVDLEDSYGESYHFEKKILNLCPDENIMGNLKKEFYYTTQVTDEVTGGTLTLASAKDMSFAFAKTTNMDANYYAESLLYIDALVQKYCTALQNA